MQGPYGGNAKVDLTRRHLLNVFPEARAWEGSQVWPWPESIAFFASYHRYGKPVVRKSHARCKRRLSYSLKRLRAERIQGCLYSHFLCASTPPLDPTRDNHLQKSEPWVASSKRWRQNALLTYLPDRLSFSKKKTIPTSNPCPLPSIPACTASHSYPSVNETLLEHYQEPRFR